MKELLKQVLEWQRVGRRFAIAKVIAVEGSGPREVGATMAVSEDGEVVGSVSGGCVEGAVVSDALARLGAPKATLERFGLIGNDPALIGRTQSVTFGYSDDEAFAVGLTCGGTLHILIQPDPPSYLQALLNEIEAERPVVVATVYALDEGTSESDSYFSSQRVGVPLPEIGFSMAVFGNSEKHGTLGNADLDRVIIRDSLGLLASGASARRHYGRSGQARDQEVGVLFEVYSLPPKMVIFGAVDFTAALSRVAKILGYRVTVCDPRPMFATPDRFPMADEVHIDWPNRYLEKISDTITERDAICVLTHDPKFDVPAIIAALRTSAGYIGAMGSRRTHSERTERLIQAGVDVKELSLRVAGPIGLNIGARTPEETAISIVAEIIAKRESKDSRPLGSTEGPIHGS